MHTKNTRVITVGKNKITIGENITIEDKNLDNIMLSGERFFKSRIEKTRFNGAILTSAVFSQTTINDVDFSNADLSHVDFTKAMLTNVKFVNTNLTNANFNGATLKEVDFSDADISDTNFCNLTFHHITLTPKKLDWFQYNNHSLGLFNELPANTAKFKCINEQNLWFQWYRVITALLTKTLGLDLYTTLAFANRVFDKMRTVKGNFQYDLGSYQLCKNGILQERMVLIHELVKHKDLKNPGGVKEMKKMLKKNKPPEIKYAELERIALERHKTPHKNRAQITAGFYESFVTGEIKNFIKENITSTPSGR